MLRVELFQEEPLPKLPMLPSFHHSHPTQNNLTLGLRASLSMASSSHIDI